MQHKETIFTLLKRLTTIEPDRYFSEASRRAVLSRAPQEPKTITFWAKYAFRLGSSVAVIAAALFLVVGGFSLARRFTPLGFSSLDPAGLRAEAQAIDIQVSLTDLNYSDQVSRTAPQGESTSAFAPKVAPVKPGVSQKKNATSTPTNPTVDDVLEILSK